MKEARRERDKEERWRERNREEKNKKGITTVTAVIN